MQLTSKILILVLLPVLVLILLAGLVADIYSRSDAQDVIEHDLASAAQLSSDLIEDRLDEVDASLRAVLTQDTVDLFIQFRHEGERAKAEQARLSLEDALKRLSNANSGFSKIELYDPDGRRIVAIVSGRSDPRPDRPNGHNWPHTAQRSPRMVTFESPGQLRLTRRMPLAKSVDQMVTASVVFDFNEPANQATRFATRHLAGVSTEIKTELYGTQFQRGTPPADGGFSAAADLPSVEGQVKMYQPTAVALSGFRRNQTITALTRVVVALVLLGLIFVGIHMTVLRPVRRINRLISAFEKEGPLPPEPADSTDQLGKLSRTLHEALSGWRCSNHELKELNETLEQRVADRSAELRESEERYALAVQGANDGLWDWNLQTNTVYYSPRWRTMLGFVDGELGEAPDVWFDRVHAEDREGLRSALDEHLDGRSPHFQHEHRMAHSDGSYRWVLSRGLAVRDNGGAPTRMAGSLTDITDRKLAEEQLRHQAIHDPLTGLFNRQHFVEQVGLAMKASRRYDHPLSLSMCDIDEFKAINDLHGHLAGDDVLLRFAQLVGEELRDADFAGRFGGDEFCVTFPHTEGIQAAVSTERIRRRFEEFEFRSNVGTFTVSASFGIAQIPSGDATTTDLMELADQALYKAKRAGRNQTVVLED